MSFVALKFIISVAFAVAPAETTRTSLSPPAPPKSFTVSVFSSTLNVSLPIPPVMISSPAPPVMISAPLPPEIISTSPPPEIISEPSPPVRVSLPVPPTILNAFEVPVAADTLIVTS